MTDLLNIAKECGAIFEGPCQACGGSGVIMETITVPVCCGRFSPHGDCCGNPDPAQECQQSQCGCGGVTFLHLSTDQLHATVEKVCGPLVEAVNALLTYDGTDSEEAIEMMINYENAVSLSNSSLSNYRKLMGQDK